MIHIGDDTYIDVHKAETRVRGGGDAGGDAWLAKIVGPHPKFGLDREFVRKQPSLSGSGRSGKIRWAIDGDGIYEYRGFAVSSRDVRGGFVRISGGTIEGISRNDAIGAVSEQVR